MGEGEKEKQYRDDINSVARVDQMRKDASGYWSLCTIIFGGGLCLCLFCPGPLAYTLFGIMAIPGCLLFYLGSRIMRCPRCNVYIGDPYDPEAGRSRCDKCNALLKWD
ncbi:MAG: hypothetical protein K2W95_22980 [Candidatus Obscuribacterales bacterium]|nr:hypothetical protein [Candidatus Obscuribacterales bacterium]